MKSLRNNSISCTLGRACGFAAILCVIAPGITLASPQVATEDPIHQRIAHQLLDDDEVFFKSKGGLVNSCAPDAALSLQRRFKLEGVEVSPDQAKALVTHMMLRSSGRDPAAIDAAMLLAPYDKGFTTQHGFLQEWAISSADPATYRLSKFNSLSVDGTIYEGGKATGSWQSKCYSTLDGSRDGVVEGFTKYLAQDYRLEHGRRYDGFIPQDQYEALRASGAIDDDGRVRDLGKLRSEMSGVVEEAARGESRGEGQYAKKTKVRELILTTGSKLSSLKDTDLELLRFRPAPGTHASYKELAVINNQHGKLGEHAVPSPHTNPRLAGTAGLVMAFALIAYDGYSLNWRSLGALDVAMTATSGAESAAMAPKLPKSAVRWVSRLPKGAAAYLPGGKSLGKIGKFAGKASAVLVAGIAAYYLYQYNSGTLSKREFTTSMGGLAGGLAGGFAGGFAGAKGGAAVGFLGGGPPGAAIGWTIGSIVGSLFGAICGAWASESSIDAYWSSLDTDELAYTLELLRQKIRAADIAVQ